MATLATNTTTLSDLVKMLGPDGKLLRFANILEKLSPVINDLPFVRGNLTTGHRVQVVTSLPSPTSRRLNQRVLPTKATSDQNDEQCAQLVDYADVDCSIAEMSGDVEGYRMKQAMLHMQGLTHEFERQFFYGNSAVVQEEMDGVLPRLAAAADNVIDAGGAGADNSSIVLACYSESTIYGITPKDLPSGIRHENKGRRVSETTAGLIDVYTDRWELNCGLCVEDPRWLAAIRAIDVSTVVADKTGATTGLINLILDLLHSVPNIDSPLVKPVLYMNRTLAKCLDIQAQNKSNLHLEIGHEEGDRKVKVRGVPIHVSDALTETESVI